jgi:predicted ribosome quality control (RQC) complex YloA/Tae2 family protein
MELSGIELRFIINEIKARLRSGYYVSAINAVTNDSFMFKMRHATESEIIMMVSTRGIWLTQMRFKPLEDSSLLNMLRSELERTKLESIEQLANERIAVIKFMRLDGKVIILIAEFFRDGNIILCDQDFQILSILRPIEVRHRTLKVGFRYSAPPSRGIDVFDITFEQFRSASQDPKLRELDILKWIGRSISLPKRFVEEIVRMSGVPTSKSVSQLSNNDLRSIFDNLKNLVSSVSTGENHAPVVVFEKDSGKLVDALPVSPVTGKSNPEISVKTVPSYMEAIDQVFTSDILDTGRSMRTNDIDKQIASLEHDMEEQNRAKEAVLLKADGIRKLASELMTLSYQHVENNNSDLLARVLLSASASIRKPKGIEYIEVMGELIPFDPNLAKSASRLFTRAKEMERGSLAIEEAKDKLNSRIDRLKNQAESIHKRVVFAKRQREKEWYERYRWFITSDGLLAIGGRDASSNSAVIRKHLTEQDIVFHAEVHGSPFFILKNARNIPNLETSRMEAAQATISFSRAWKDGLSAADAYWFLPEQLKKGAPTGQYLPKGSFVIEGRRNYLKGVEIRLAVGIVQVNNQYALACGPVNAIKKRSVLYVTILPGGHDLMDVAKKIKTEFYAAAINTSDSKGNAVSNERDINTAFVKNTSVDDLIRMLPPGQSKISIVGAGELQDVLLTSTGIDQPNATNLLGK